MLHLAISLAACLATKLRDGLHGVTAPLFMGVIIKCMQTKPENLCMCGN